MHRKLVKALLFLLYFVAGGIACIFLPPDYRYIIGYAVAIVSSWAWKVMNEASPTPDVKCCCESPDTNPAMISECCPIHNPYPPRLSCRGFECECCELNDEEVDNG